MSATMTEPKRGTSGVKYFGGKEGKALTNVAPIDELPPEQPHVRKPRGPSATGGQYFEMLNVIGSDEDRLEKWTPVAQFGTPGGAKTIATQLNKQVRGEVNVEGQEKQRGYINPEQVRRIPGPSDDPSYTGWVWQFDSRRTTLEDGNEGSTLYAKLHEIEKAKAVEEVEGSEAEEATA